MLAPWHAFWQARSVRERRVLAGGIGLSAVLLVYATLWRPMVNDIAHIEEQLPRFRAEAAELAAAAEEHARLRAKAPANIVRPSDVESLLSRSAAGHGLEARVASSSGNERITVSVDRAPFESWIGWVDELHRTHRLVIAACRIGALDAPGWIRAEAQFAPAGAAR